jgi:predicted oxidoreductase
METQILGASGLPITRIAYGCMSLGRSWDDSPLAGATRQEALRIICTALDQGITFFDHADIYCRGKSEEVFGSLWTQLPVPRDQVILQSKCGIRFPGSPRTDDPQRFDFSYGHIVSSVEGSLKRLNTGYLDVLLLHRPDPLVEPEEVARAFDDLSAAGKVRWFGVSNHTAAQLDLLRAYVRQPVVANQVAFNVIHTHLLNEGIIFNQDNPLLTRNEGTIEYCRKHNITLQAWGSLAWGQLTGRAVENPPEKTQKTAALVAKMAAEKGVSGEAILIAWILRHPAKIQAIIGTTNLSRIQASCQADGLALTREEWYMLFNAGRGETLP